MNRKTPAVTLTLAATIALGLVLCESSQAAAPYSTSGGADPTTQGAVAVFSTGAPAVQISSGNDGEDYWRLKSGPYPGDSGGAHYTYSMVAADTTDPSGWTFTYRAKIIDADRSFEAYFAVVDAAGDAWLGTLLGGPHRDADHGGPATQYYQHGVVDEAIFPVLAHDWPGTEMGGAMPNDTTAYHTYQIVYDPGTSMGKWYLDGVLSFSQAAGDQVFAGTVTPTRIEWGDGQGTGSATGTVEQWSLLRFELGQHPIVIVPPLPGDVNFDGVVNIFDINLVSAHWGEAGPDGDANNDMIVNIFDITLISANWTPTGGAGSAVPEPSTIVLLGLAGLTAIPLLGRGRRQK